MKDTVDRNWRSHPLWSNESAVTVFLALATGHIVSSGVKTGQRTHDVKTTTLIKTAIEFCASLEGAPEYSVSISTSVRRFINRESSTMNDFAALNCVLVYLCNVVPQNHPKYRTLTQLYDVWSASEIIAAHPLNQIPSNLTRVSRIMQGHPLAVTAETYLSVGSSEFSECSELLTSHQGFSEPLPTDDLTATYDGYRFSATAGEIIKTTSVFTPPNQAEPFLKFVNTACSGEADGAEHGVARVSSGIAFMLHSGIYCFGKMGEGFAMKVLALRRPNSFESAKEIDGLVMTIDEKSSQIAARILLKRREKRGVKPGRYSAQELQDELTKKDLDRIRNHVEFELDRTVVDTQDGLRVSTNDIVSLTRKLLHYTVSETSERLPRFKYEDNGEEFNPASHSDYPFNQALKIF